MPPSQKFSREQILQTAYEIAKKEGLDQINARRIAGELKCSTQPIYHNFSTMRELKEQVMERIIATYTAYMEKGAKAKRAYLGMGMAYIRFAKDYPSFFQELFMRESGLSPADYIENNQVGREVIHKGRAFTGLTEAEQKEFHLKVWMFTHGLAALSASNTVNFTDTQIQTLLAETTGEMLVGFQNMREREEK